MADIETTTRTLTVDVAGIGSVPIALTERGSGPPVLLLHGGGGPLTVTGFADFLATKRHARVLTPIHPGFGGTERPDGLATIRELATAYDAVLSALDLSDVTVVGNSIGGWIAAELALRNSPRVSNLVLIDSVGIEVPGHPVVDFFSLDMAQVAALSYHEPDKFRIDPAALPPEAQAAMAGNRAALAVYGGTTMTDPSLAARLAGITVPSLVVWGEADRIADVDYGRAYAAAIPGARFELLTETGHLPQLETPDKLLQAVWGSA